MGTMLSRAAGEKFDFVVADDTLGFGRTHNVQLTNSKGRPLTARSTGNDPYFYSPPIALRGVADGELVLRAAFVGPVSHLRVFFTTERSPGTSEQKAMSVRVRADRIEREVRIPIGRHEQWRGTITLLRFDLDPVNAPGAAMHLSSVRYVYPSVPRLGDLRTSASVVAPNAAVDLSVEIENIAPDPATEVELRFEADSDAIAVSPAHIGIDRLASEEKRVLRATVHGRRAGVAILNAVFHVGDKEIERRCAAFCVVPDWPEPERVSRWMDMRPQKQPRAIYRTPDMALVLGLDEFSGLAEWWAVDGDGYERVGRIFPMVSLLHGADSRRLDVVRWTSHREGAHLLGEHVLVGELGSGADKVADLRMRMWPEGDLPPLLLRFEVELEAKKTLALRAFTSPRVLVGDGAFGRERDEALFPGLEYLEKSERSSSRLDYRTADYLRTVPHPKKITFPLMAVTHAERLLMLKWEFPQPNNGGLRAPAAGFASPNFVDGQANHLMTLFWPSVPGGVPENEWEAKTPVKIQPGERWTLGYYLGVMQKPGIHVTEAIPFAFSKTLRSRRKGPGGYALPERDRPVGRELERGPIVQKPPRDDASERALCRVAYTDVIWHEDAAGWNHAVSGNPNQWPPGPFAFNIEFLEAERATMPAGPDRERVSQIVEKAAALRWEQHGKRPGGEDYFFVGNWIAGCVEARGRHAHALMQRQREDGAWVFEPGDDRRAQLGERGKPEVGIVANNANVVLAYALMTGNREAEAAGLAALEHMKRYVVPRAAQVWEIPVHTPDIMGSARAAEAYRLGYLITGEKEYLEQAEYWNATGLPFVYFWGHPRWPYWYGATIPVLGATFYRAPNWIGLPVQWCGLVYAEEALRFAELTGDPFYKTVATAIVHSGMWQQPTKGRYRGLLPDSYAFAADEGNGPFINPETILRPYWLLRGYDFRVNSIALARGEDRSLRLSARAKIGGAEMADGRTVKARLSQVEGLPFGALLCGVKGAPERVEWNGKPVPERARLSRDEPGWRYLADREWLAVSLVGTGEAGELTVRLAAK
jgi:hypothetical protein